MTTCSPTPVCADLQRLGVGIDHAVLLLIALVVADHLQDLQSHQAGGGGGHLVLGVGRIIVVRGDRPAGLALDVHLGHLERMDLAPLLVELDDLQAGHGQRVGEVGIERLVADVFRAGDRQRRPGDDDQHHTPRPPRPRRSGFSRFRSWEVLSYQLSVVSQSGCQSATHQLQFDRRLRSRCCSAATAFLAYRNLDRATPSRSRARRVKNTNTATSSGGIGGNSTAHILYWSCTCSHLQRQIGLDLVDLPVLLLAELLESWSPAAVRGPAASWPPRSAICCGSTFFRFFNSAILSIDRLLLLLLLGLEVLGELLAGVGGLLLGFLGALFDAGQRAVLRTPLADLDEPLVARPASSSTFSTKVTLSKSKLMPTSGMSPCSRRRKKSCESMSMSPTTTTLTVDSRGFFVSSFFASFFSASSAGGSSLHLALDMGGQNVRDCWSESTAGWGSVRRAVRRATSASARGRRTVPVFSPVRTSGVKVRFEAFSFGHGAREREQQLLQPGRDRVARVERLLGAAAVVDEDELAAENGWPWDTDCSPAR